MSLPRWLPRFPFALAVAASVSCGPGPVVRPPRPASVHPRAAAERMRWLPSAEAPDFRLIERAGDPEPSLAVAFDLTGLPVTNGAQLLAAFLGRKLEGIDVVTTFVVTTTSVEVIGTGDGTQLLVWLGVLRDAVLSGHAAEPGTPQVPPRETPPQSRFGNPCTGYRLGKSPPLEATPDELRELLDFVGVEDRVGLGGVGPRPFIEAATKVELGAWRKEASPAQGAPLRPVDEFRKSTEARVERFTWVPSHERAVAALARLRGDESTLGARVALIDRRATGRADVTFRPRGACLRLAAEIPEGAISPRTLAMLDEALTWETSLALREEPSVLDGLATALLHPSASDEAARLAALAALLPPENAPSFSFSVFQGAAEDILRASQRALLENRENESFPLAVRDESGQAETVLLVASSCGTAREANPGERALALRAAAAHYSGRWGVQLAPWVSTDGVGLLARASRRADESAESYAARVTLAIRAALFAPTADWDLDFAQARHDLLAELGDSPAAPVALRILSGGAPSALFPFGLSESVALVAPSDLERIRGELREEPLRGALLAVEEGEAAAFEAALTRDFGPNTKTSGEACPTIAPAPSPLGGVWTVTTTDSRVVTTRVIGISVATDRETGHGIARFLSRPDGPIARGLAGTKLVTGYSVSFLGGPTHGGLLITFAAAAKELDPAENQLRAILAALSKRQLSSDEVLSLQKELDAWHRAAAKNRTSRVVELYLGKARVPLQVDELTRVLRAFDEKSHLLFRVNVRK